LFHRLEAIRVSSGGFTIGMGTRVVVADSQLLFRGAVVALIEQAGGYEIVGQASDGEEALALIEEHAPELVMLELSLPSVSGAEVVRRAKRSGSHARFLFISECDRREDVEEALQAGADGYVAKRDSTSDLLTAIERVSSGQIHLSPSVTGHLVEIALHRDRGFSGSGNVQLSSREREVLRLIAEGSSNKEIAVSLGLSVRTIDSHRATLMEKLGIHKVSGLVRYAIREGLLKP
jgi:DNA-binding NarL/FixJ family response regulator